MSTLPIRGSRANKPHTRKPYERDPPSPGPQLARSKSSFFNTVKAVFTGWFSTGESAHRDGGREQDDKHLKRRPSRSKLENGTRAKRIRTVSPQRISAPKSGYLDPPEHMIRPGGSLGRSSKLIVNSDTEQSQLSVRNTPLGFGTYRPPRSPSRRTPSIGSWFPQPASTRNSLAPRASQVHFGPSNLEIDTAIASYDDTRMQSRSPSVGVGVGLGRERTPSKAIPGREASLSLPMGGRTSLSRATGSNLRASISAANPFSSLGKSASLAPERRKSNLIWDDNIGVTKVEQGKPKAPSAPPAKNTAERLLNALENMHTLTGDAQRPRRRPPPYVQVPAPGPGDRRARMIQPYGEVKVSPNKPKKSGESRRKSGLMKMLMKNKKEVQEEDMDMEETAQPSEPKEVTPDEKVTEKAKAKDKDADTDMESDSAPASKPATTTTSSAPKVVDNFRPASQPPSRPGSSLRQSKTVTKRAHAPSAGRNRFSANNEEEEEDDEAVEKRNAELLAVASANVFKVPEGFKFGAPSVPAAPKPAEPSKVPELVSPQPISAKPVATSVLSFTPPTAPAKETSSPAPSFFGSSNEASKAAVPEIKNPFASVGTTKPEIKVPEVPKWGSVPSSSAPTPPPKATEGASPFANIGVAAKPTESAPSISFGKPAEKPATDNPFASIGKPAVENPFGKVDKPKAASENPFASIGKPAGDSPFANIGKPAAENPFGGASKPAGDNPFAGIGASTKSGSSTPALPFSFGGPKSETKSASATPAPAIPSFFSKPAEESKPVEAPKPAEPVAEAPKPAPEPAKPSPFSFGTSKPAEKPAAAPFSFGAPSTTPAATPAPAPTPSPFSFGAPSAPVPTPAAPAPTAKPTFAFGLPASTPSPAPSVTEAPKKNPFDFSAPAVTPAPTEAPKKNPFDFSAPTPSAPAAAPLAPTTSKSPFDFSSAAKPAEQPASPFTFGATPTPTPGPAPVPATTEKKNPFDFSGSSQKPASSTPFTFGAPAPAPASNGFTFGAAPARPSTPPSGGDAAMEESPTRDPAPSKIVTSGFGGATGTGFTFGSNTNGSSGPFGNSNGAAVTGPFGGPLNGASSTQSNGLASATATTPSPFAFGSSNNTSGGFGSATGSGFGTSAPAAPASTPAFTFGAGGGFGQTPSATSSPSNPFGQPQPTPTPFGQPNPTPTNAFPTPSSPFPAASPALSTVGFPNNAAPSNNAFGSVQPAANGFPGSPATPAFTFGGANPAAAAASPSTFTFGLPGGTSTPATPTGTSSPFVFGQGAAPSGPEGSPAPGVQFNLGTAEASPGGRKIKPLRRPRRN